MKIAIDSGPLSSGDSVRGIGTYTRELLKALKMDGVDVFKEDLAKYDIVHFTSFKPFVISLPFAKPLKTKFVLTIHDLIPLIYPKHYPPGVRGRLNWLINKRLIRKNIDAIIAVSETSKKDICRFLGVDPKMVHVIHSAPRSVFKKMENGNWQAEIKKHYGLPGRFVLYVGDVNYNKNIPDLVKACKIANTLLVIAGKQAKDIEKQNLDHPELSHLKGIDWSGVTRLSFVPDSDLVKIYNLASVYVQPSFYEGFGLGVLEALACGTPVVAAKTQALVEIAEGAVAFADPGSPKALAEAILNPLKSFKLPRDYSWTDTAKKTYDVYKGL